MTPTIEKKKSTSLELNFGPGMPYEGVDSRIVSSHKDFKNYDVIIFTDSRGGPNSPADSAIQCWPDIVIDYLQNLGFSYMLISRPKDITVFFTLVNFFELNSISCKYLITNVGFVDLTPKKRTIADDILAQRPELFAHNKIPYILFNPYTLSDGSIEPLYSLDYSEIYSVLASFLRKNFKATILLETLECSPEIVIPRKRPPSFFSQLQSTNKLLQQLATSSENIHFLRVYANQTFANINLTYDAVHFTPLGHQLMGREILKHLATDILI